MRVSRRLPRPLVIVSLLFMDNRELYWTLVYNSTALLSVSIQCNANLLCSMHPWYGTPLKTLLLNRDPNIPSIRLILKSADIHKMYESERLVTCAAHNVRTLRIVFAEGATDYPDNYDALENAMWASNPVALTSLLTHRGYTVSALERVIHKVNVYKRENTHPTIKKLLYSFRVLRRQRFFYGSVNK